MDEGVGVGVFVGSLTVVGSGVALLLTTGVSGSADVTLGVGTGVGLGVGVGVGVGCSDSSTGSCRGVGDGAETSGVGEGLINGRSEAITSVGCSLGTGSGSVVSVGIGLGGLCEGAELGFPSGYSSSGTRFSGTSGPTAGSLAVGVAAGWLGSSEETAVTGVGAGLFGVLVGS